MEKEYDELTDCKTCGEPMVADLGDICKFCREEDEEPTNLE